MDWQQFWDTYPSRSDPGNLLGQVGKTVAGVPISPELVGTIIDDIVAALDLRPDDVVLDLCCGNGLVTQEVARRCRRVVAIDFSRPLIEQARAQCQLPNVEYHLLDVRNLDRLVGGEPFDKVVMYEALAFFGDEEITTVLREILIRSKPDVRILFGSFLDAARKWRFFNTWRRRWTYLFWIKLLGRDPGVGKWWSRRRLNDLAKRAGFRCAFRNQHPKLHTAHYRTDAVLLPAVRIDQRIESIPPSYSHARLPVLRDPVP